MYILLELIVYNTQKERDISSLPSQFSDVQPLVFVAKDVSPPPPPPLTGQLPAAKNKNNYGYKKEVQRLDNVKELISKKKLESDNNICRRKWSRNKWQNI